MANQYNYQLHLIKALCAEKRYWNTIDSVFDDVCVGKQITRVCKLVTTVNELPPQALLRAIKLLAIFDVDKEKAQEVFADIFSKVFRKQIDWCENQKELNFTAYMVKFYDETMSINEIAKLGAGYIHIRACLGFEEDDCEELRELFDGINCTEQPIEPSTETKKRVAEWLKAHNNPMTLNALSYDEDVYTSEMTPLELISKEENIPVRAYENYTFNRADINEMFELASLIGRPYSLNKYLGYAYMFKSLAKYAEECKNAYIDLAISPEASPNKTVKKQLSTLLKQIESFKIQIAEKQEKLNYLQQNFDRVNRKFMDVQEKYDELAEYTEILEQQLELANTPVPVQEDTQPISLDGKNVVVIGGHDSWQQKLKEVYTDFTYIPADDLGFDVNIVRNADIIVFNFIHCSHGLFYRLRENCDRKKIVYLASNNLNNFKMALTKGV